jgi:lysozyme
MSPQGLTWLALLEGGHRLDAYLDNAGVWTIGAGITFYRHGIRVKKGDRLRDKEAAEALFRERLREYEAEVDARTHDDINQASFDALTSFCFNAGPSAFRSSTAVKRFNDPKCSPDSVATALLWWNKSMNPASGKLEVNAGLTERRRCEAYLLLYGLYRTQKQPKPELGK